GAAVVIFSSHYSRFIRAGVLPGGTGSPTVRSIGIHKNVFPGVFHLADSAPAPYRYLLDLQAPHRWGQFGGFPVAMAGRSAEKSPALSIRLYGTDRTSLDPVYHPHSAGCRRLQGAD